MKPQLVFEMPEERLEGVRGLRKPGMVDEGTDWRMVQGTVWQVGAWLPENT